VTENTQPPLPAPKPSELEAEILRARAQLASTIDELVTRLSPKTIADNVTNQAKQAASDTGAFLVGAGLPDDDPKRARNAKIFFAVTSVSLALAAMVIVRAVVRHSR
jgi:predicted permease